MKARYKISCSVVAIISSCTGAALAAEQTAAVPDTSGIEEIVVTAQRRTESIQDVPNTIQAFSSRTLEQLNVESVDQLVKYTPNVTFASNGPGAGNIFMRGLSSGFAGNQSSAAVGPFPNVAVYLDDQSMTFPHRNVDVFMVDMERVEVLEGPQGTLFGGGAEAGAVRYITNKPKMNVTEGYAEASGGTTAHGDPNYGLNATLNVPLVDDKLSVRAVIYDDHRGGYIDNVPSRFVRKPTDLGPASYSTVYPATLPVENNSAVAGKAQNPLNYGGARLSALYNVNDDWDVLIQQSFQNMEADGMFVQYPTGSDGQKLNPLEVTSFSPVWDKDNFWNTSWTVNGHIGDMRLVYTGAYLHRHIDQTMDYTNYARTAGGFYYQCVGGPASGSNIGAGRPGVCYSAISNWHDIVTSTHQSHEVRVATPDNWQLRGLAGFFYEDLDIRDNMNFQYKSIPSCTPAALAAYQAGGPVCLGNVAPAQGSFANDPTARGDAVAFGEDQDRGYTQKAFFVSIDYDIIPQVLTITGGTRYYDYDEGMEGSQYSTGAKCLGLTNGTCYGTPITAATHAASYSGFKSRGNLTWHITPDAMVYYTFSQGFRPGAGNRLTGAVTKIDINPATGRPTTGVDNTPTLVNQVLKPYTYAPDSLDNHEVGFKTDFFDKRLILNGSVYYMQWKNVQTLIFNPPVFGNTTFGVNGPDYDIKGFELQYAARIADGLSSEGSVSYNDAKETNSPCMVSSNNVANNPTPLGSCVTQVWSAPAHMNVPIVNPLGAVDATPAFSPKLQFNARVRYDWMMENYGAFMMVGVTHTSSMFNQPSSFPSGEGVTVPTTTYLRFTQPDYTTFDASIGVSKDNWHAEIYGQNIGNSHASTFTSTAQFIRSEVPLRPRVVGVKIGSKF